MFTIDVRQLHKLLPSRPQRLKEGWLWKTSLWRSAWATFLVFLMGFQSAQMVAGSVHVPAPAISAYVEPLATPMVAGAVDPTGSFTGSSRALLLFQDGARVFGDFSYSTSQFTFEGTQNGNVVSGTLKYPNGSNTSYTVTATYAADGNSISLVDPWGPSSVTKQSTISMRLDTTRKVLAYGGVQPFRAFVAGAIDKAVTWTATGGTIDAAGTFTAPGQGGIYTIKATSVANAATTATATVMVTVDGLMEVSGSYTGSPRTLLLFQEGTRVFGNFMYSTLAFTFEGTQSGGAVSGVLSYPNGSATSYTLTLTTSPDGTTLYVTDPWGQGTLTKQSTVSVRMATSQRVMKPGDTFGFKAWVAGAFDKSINWSATRGNIDAAGSYTAGAQAGVATITATAAANSAASAPATVMVTMDGLMEVTGTFTGTSRTILFFKDGARVFGDFMYSTSGFTFEGTQSGNVVSGKLTNLNGTATSYTLTATYAPDGASFALSDPWGTATLTKQSTVTVRLAANRRVMKVGDSFPFQAWVAGPFDKSVIWSASGGTLSGSGTFTASGPAGIYTITATSTATPTASATGTVMATADGLTEVSGTFQGPGKTLTFFQDGTRVFGDYFYSTTPYLFEGTQAGGTVSGTLSYTSGAATGYTLTATYSADGTQMMESDPWGATTLNKQPVVAIRMVPNKPQIVMPGAQLTYKALIGGSWDKSAGWTATAGSVVNGTYTVPTGFDNTAQTLVATATADPSKQALAQVSITPTGILEVSGVYKDGSNYQFALFQNGTTLMGEWVYGGTKFSFQGTLAGYVLTGKVTPANSTAQYNVVITFAPDAKTFSGTNAYVGNWTGSKQSGTTAISVSPGAVTLRTGASQAFTASVTGLTNPAVLWTVIEANGGTISTAGVYTAPSTPGSYTVKATLVADPTKVASVPVVVRPPVVVTPLTLQLSPGSSSDFAAQLTGFTNTAVIWTATGGSITTAGRFTAPQDAGTYTITATSVESPSLSASATVTVPFSITVVPAGPLTLGTSRSQAFTAVVSGAADKSVLWEVVAPGLGTITPEGLYTAPQTLPNAAGGATLQVKATSVARPTESKFAQVNLRSSILVSPQAPTVKPGGNQLFTAALYGATGSVIWSATGGTMGSAGQWTAPDLAGSYTITATSADDGTLIGTSLVTVPVTLTWSEFTPDRMLILPGLPWTMNAAVKGSTNKRVLWSFEGITTQELACPGNGVWMGTGSPDPTTPGASMAVGHVITPDAGSVGGCGPAVGRTFTLIGRAEADPNATVRVVMESRALAAIWPMSLNLEAEKSYIFKDVTGMGMSTGFDPYSGQYIVDPISSSVSLMVTGGTAQWLDADRVSNVGNATVRTGAPLSGGGSAMVYAFPVLNDLKYTAPDTAGTYYLSLAPHINPEVVTTVTIHVPFIITVTHDVPAKGLLLGQTAHFAAQVSGSPNKAVDWSIPTSSNPALQGTISPDGTYTPVSDLPANLNYLVVWIRASSQADPSKHTDTIIYVTRAAYLTSVPPVAPAQDSRPIGVSMGVTPLNPTDFTWTCSGGTITPNGVWTYPDLEGVYTVTATSKADPSVQATGSTSVYPVIVLTPPWTTLSAGSTQQFQADVRGLSDKSVVWSVSDPSTGTTTQDGLFTAASTFTGLQAGQTIMARSVAKPSLAQGASITITKEFAVNPGTRIMDPGESYTSFQTYQQGQRVDSDWACTGGSITSAGIYTAPDLAGTYTITATNRANLSQTATATVTVPVRVKITPNPVPPVRIATTASLSATVQGSLDQRVTWKVAAPATIDPDGTFHAPDAASRWYGDYYYVSATSVADPTAFSGIGVFVRRPLAINPEVLTLAAGASTTFSSLTAGLSGDLLWTCSSGTITQAGVYTAPPQAGTYTVTVSSLDEPAITATATVTVPIAVKVTPTSIILPMGFTQGFLAAVSGDPMNKVTWKSAGPTMASPAGTINQFGAFTPPNVAGTYTVTATSVVDPTKQASATVKVPQALVITPERVTLKPLGTRKLTAMGTTPTGTPAVTWWASAGTVTADGTYTAPAELGTYYVTATSTTDAKVSATAEIRVTAQGAITIDLTPDMVQLKKGETMSFSALVSGATNPALTWSTSGGTVEPDGHYTAPTQFGTFTVTAMSVEDPTVKAEATIVVAAQAGEDQSFTYDENGNMLSDGQRTFEWDVENRLVSVTKGQHRTEFEYDPLGRRSRIIEKDADGQGGWTTGSDKRYLWVGAEIVEEEAADGSTLKAFYGQGFVDTDGTALFYTGDHMGNIRELLDMSGTVRARYDYDPYGRATKTTGDRDSFFLYAGYQYHPQSGLYLTLYRGYDPGFGRWISRDPIEEEAGTNVYAYVLGNPINFIDPYGLDGLGTVGSFVGRWGGRIVGGVVGEFIDPLGGGIPGEIIGGMVGDWVGQALGDWADKAIAGSTTLADRYFSKKPPKDACDPKGAKSPGKPGANEGFKDPKSGETWGKAKNGKWGWVDDKGNVWVPTGPEGSPDAHGGPHWDVQKPGGGYVNVYPGGKTR